MKNTTTTTTTVKRERTNDQVANIILRIYQNLGNFKKSNALAKFKCKYNISNKRYTSEIKLLLQQSAVQRNENLKKSLNFEFWALVKTIYDNHFQTNEKFVSSCIEIKKHYENAKHFVLDNYRFVDSDENLLDVTNSVYQDIYDNYYKVATFNTLDVNSLLVQKRIIAILIQCFNTFALKHKKNSLGKKDNFSNIFANNSVKSIQKIGYDFENQTFKYESTTKTIEDLDVFRYNFAKDTKELIIEALKPQPKVTKSNKKATKVA